MAFPSSASPNIPSSRRSSGSSDLVSLSSSDSGEESTSDVDIHRSSSTVALGDFPPSTSPIPTRERHSASQSSTGTPGNAASAQNGGSASPPPVSVAQQPKNFTYEMLDPEKLAQTEFEAKGLLFARSTKAKDNQDLLSPADEVAEEVECAEQGVQGVEVQHVTEMMQPTFQIMERRIAPIDPGVLLELERSAKHVAEDLVHVMENLRNSLHAMTVCTKQSMQLHRESVDNLHLVVDANVKAMYSFMAKFDELQKNFAPLQQLAQQINEMDENLKLLERTFAKT